MSLNEEPIEPDIDDGVEFEMPPPESSIWSISESGELKIDLHAGQIRAWASTALVVAVIAGAQSGKTSFGPLWLMKEIIDRGPGEYGVIAPTYPLLSKKALPEFKRLFQFGLKYGTYVAVNKRFTFNAYGLMKMFGTTKYPCSVVFLHAADPDALESATFKGAWLDEAGQQSFKGDSYYALGRRLALNTGRMLITTTPYNLGWLKTKIYDPWKKWMDTKEGDDPRIDVINFRSIDNPYFPLDSFLRARATMPRWKHDLFYCGIFTVPNGAIFDNFRDEIHTVTPFPIPENWPRVWGVDFGQINFAIVKIAINPHWVPGSTHPEHRRYYVYQVYKPEGSKEISAHIASIKASDVGSKNAICFGGSKGESRWRNDFSEQGLYVYEPTLSGPDSVEPGIAHVYKTFATGELAYFNNLSWLIDETKTYARKLDANDEITQDILNKNTFHLLDALRYSISEIISNPGILEPRKIISTWKSA